MPTLHDYLDSGNGYKIRLLLAQLKQPYRWVGVDIMKGETRTPQFLAKNPNGRIPTLELDDGTCLAESNAIMWYLAEGTPYVPADRLGRAQALQWMFFEQYSHEPYVATPRFIVKPHAEGFAALQGTAGPHGEGPRRARRDGSPSRFAHVLRERALLDRRHRALRLHARFAGSGFRSLAVSERAVVDGPHRRSSRGTS